MPGRKASIRQIKNNWRVGTIRVSGKGTRRVTWNAPNNVDVYLQFMETDLFGRWNFRFHKSGSLPVKKEARKGDHHYAIFCLPKYKPAIQSATKKLKVGFAKGGSPPTIIIQ